MAPKARAKVGHDETGWPDEQGPNPEIVSMVLDGTLPEVVAYVEAVEREEELAVLESAPPVCDRLACENIPTLICSNCGANYCDDHPPLEDDDPETCDACGFDLSPDNPHENFIEQHDAKLLAIQEEQEAEARRLLEEDIEDEEADDDEYEEDETEDE